MTQSRRPCEIETTAIDVVAHGGMLDWLATSGGSLAVTTYNSGKLALFSAPRGQLQTRAWKFPRPMGLSARGGALAIATRRHIAVFQSSPANDHDASTCYALDQLYDTGRLNVHDLAFARDRLYFANTRYNCLARPSDRVRFLRSWQPRFMSEMIGKDCCHLNGLGIRNGRPAMMTAFAEVDRPRGWRELDRFQSGVVIDVRRNVIVARGLNMPHSPRWHAGRWWVCESGAGVLATLDPRSGGCDEFAALPGFTRGLCFVGEAALVGTSRIRSEHILDSPPLRRRSIPAQAGVSLVDSSTGSIQGSLEFRQGGSEVFEVAFLPGVTDANLAYKAEQFRGNP